MKSAGRPWRGRGAGTGPSTSCSGPPRRGGSVGRRREPERAEADVVERLAVEHGALVRVVDELVRGDGHVVGLDDRVADLGRRDHRVRRPERVVRDARDAADLRGVDGRAPGGHGLVQGVLDDGQRVRAARACRRAVVHRRCPAERRRGRVAEGVPARPTTRTGWRVTAARDVKPAPPKPRVRRRVSRRAACAMVFRCCASQEKRRGSKASRFGLSKEVDVVHFGAIVLGAARGSSSRAGLYASRRGRFGASARLEPNSIQAFIFSFGQTPATSDHIIRRAPLPVSSAKLSRIELG